MRFAGKTAFLAALVLGIGLVVVGASAKTPDGETPAEENVCDGKTGAAFGLCNAYCEAQDCDVHERRSCERLRTNYERQTGTDVFPCDPRCGDGVVNLDFEECDDGNNEPGDGCSPSCREEFCGDGVVSPGLGEQCEVDGDCIDPSVCSANCECVVGQSGCTQLNDSAQGAINAYLVAVNDFLTGGSTTCQDLIELYGILNENVDKCRNACGVLPCPSKPLAPGGFPGTESCTVQ